MRIRIAIVSLALVALPFTAVAADPEPKTEEEKAFYAVGISVAYGLAGFTLSPSELELVKAGLTDAALKRPLKVQFKPYAPKIQEIQKSRIAAVATVEKEAGKKFIEKAAAEKGAVKTASGMIYKEIKAGSGDAPTPADRVLVHYKGTLTDGTEVDSSPGRTEPVPLPMNVIIKCWVEGLQLMKAGGKAQFVCPSELAYGDRPQPPHIKPGATLVFDIELLEVVH